MRVAWVTHHFGAGNPAEGWLPGPHRGGGEMTDAAWRDAAPAGVQVELVAPDDWEQALGADRVVVTGTDLLSEKAMRRLAKHGAAVALHHAQKRTAGRQALLEAADPLIVHTPAHEAWERRWVAPRRVVHVLSPMDPAEFPPAAAERQRVAVWAARNHPLKGHGLAAAWAARHRIPLQTITGQPRQVVLAALANAEWMVHLPREFESEGRAVIEAVLSGCKVAANRLVGVTSLAGWRDPGTLAELTGTAGERFWEAVLS